MFEHIFAALVHGSGYELIASVGCSDRTIRRRVKEWANVSLVLKADIRPGYDSGQLEAKVRRVEERLVGDEPG